MSGSASAMKAGTDVRKVTAWSSDDDRAVRVGNVASCEGCEVFDEREISANVEGESAAAMRYGYRRGKSFEG